MTAIGDRAAIAGRWAGLLATGSDERAVAAISVADQLCAAYAALDRHYHGLAHIEALLGLVEAEADRLCNRRAVELAALFHDAVYDARHPKGNEAASAALASDRLAALGHDAALVGKVARFVEATAHFAASAPPADPDLARFLDLDLAVLAGLPTDYDAYAAAIRREYAHVPDADYRPGRAKVLRTLLARPRIYLTDDHRAAWEVPARANLAREIAALTGR